MFLLGEQENSKSYSQYLPNATENLVEGKLYIQQLLQRIDLEMSDLSSDVNCRGTSRGDYSRTVIQKHWTTFGWAGRSAPTSCTRQCFNEHKR